MLSIVYIPNSLRYSKSMKEINSLLITDKRRTIRAAILFSIFIILYESYTLKISYSHYFINLIDTQNIFSATLVTLSIAVSFLLFFLFILFSFSTTWLNKSLCLLLFCISVFVESGFQKALRRFSDPFDFQSVFTATAEQQIDSLFLYFNFSALIPCALFLVCLLFFKSKSYIQKGRHLLLICGLFTLFFVFLYQFGDYFIEKKFPTLTLGAFCRTNISSALENGLAINDSASSANGENLLRQPVVKPQIAPNYRPTNNIIFVLDESVLGNHFSLNGYERPTTPYLDNLSEQENFHNWGIASSAATASLNSYKMLIAGITPDDLPDKTNYKLNKYPTFFQYAKAMNYKTYYFDGQMNENWSGVGDDKNFVDQWVGIDHIGDASTLEKWEIDNQIALRVKEIIKNSTGNFIFIYKHGSHIPYQKNFPQNAVIWYPSYNPDRAFDIPGADKLDEVINSYDNSLHYNINSFFKNLVDDYTNIPNNTVIVYTSDHGQTLFEGGKASHGGESKIEAAVPLFIIGDLGKQVDTDYKASHQNIFPTLLDLMSFPENLRHRNEIPSLLNAKSSDSKPRFFNPNFGAKIPFD